MSLDEVFPKILQAKKFLLYEIFLLFSAELFSVKFILL